MEGFTVPTTRYDSEINVIISDDNMAAGIVLEKRKEEEAPDADPGGETVPVTEELLLEALKERGIVYGIREDQIRRLAAMPMNGIRFEAARGDYPINGENGYVNFFVKRDSEYKPEYREEGIIDYKNLDYFQQVTGGQLLCEVVKETVGTDGRNIFGAVVPAKKGSPPPSPMGKNTLFNEAGTQLTAACDGVVRFVKDSIDVSEVLHIRSNVDQKTGNIHFPGDVIIDGDVCYGFSVKSGGNIMVKGMVEGASIEASGDIHVSKGINGTGGKQVTAGGSLRSGYIESAELLVEGDLSTDYIFDSNILCRGNIILAGKNELIVGGSVRLLGELTAKYIGNENERPTRIEVMGIKVADTESITRIEKEREEYNNSAMKLFETLNRYSHLGSLAESGPVAEQLGVLKQQLTLLKGRIDEATQRIDKLKAEGRVEYAGAILCKRKIYQGVKIYFGEELFRFELDDIEHCRIFWCEGEIIQGTL